MDRFGVAPGEVAAARRVGAEHSAGRRDGGAGDPGDGP